MDEKVITIEKVVFEGKGLSRDLHKITFVPYTLPGEKVRVRITREHRDYLEAEAIEIVEPNPDRVSPDCRYFGRCGGCQMSHAKYGTQLKLKKAMLEETLTRNHINCPDIQVIASEPFGYRHRARLKYNNKQLRLGFFESESNQIVDIQECLCLTPGLNRLLKLLRSNLAPVPIHGLSEIECFENDRGETALFFNTSVPPTVRRSLESETRILESTSIESAALTLHFRDYEYPMRPDIFLQINPKLWKAMIQEAESHHEESADTVAVELYCGAGFFTLPLSKRFKKIIACEENESAIRYAKKNYLQENIDWICAKAEHFPLPKEATVAVVDPPRAGLHKKVIESFLKQQFERITYVSCDPSSFARDVGGLSSSYYVTRLTMLDLFPQTFHFETIGLLEKKAQGVARASSPHW